MAAVCVGSLRVPEVTGTPNMSNPLQPEVVYREALNMVQTRMMDTRQLRCEYRTVQELDRLIDHEVQRSQQPENAACNRYINVLPYDFNRVQLCSGASYINASHVRCSDRISSQDFAYIATQGPLQSTIGDFWAMVLEHQVPVIVMLTNVVERGVTKCARYFPDREGERLSCSNGVEVSTMAIERTSDAQMTVRTLHVSRQGSQPLVVQHYHYHAWPDHGTPEESAAIRKVCEALQQQREAVAVAGAAASQSAAGGLQGAPGNGSGCGRPQAIVHCSAGIGRTGTFVAVDIVCQRLHKLAQRAVQGELPQHTLQKALSEALDLPTLVHELRQQRMGMVQTVEQYIFIYTALHEELEHALRTHTA